MTGSASRRYRVAVGGLVLAVILGLLAHNGIQVLRGWDDLRPVRPGRVAPGFALARGRGARTSLSALAGKVVLLDFWASWCIPCKRAIPSLRTLQRELGHRGLRVVSINVEGSEERAEELQLESGQDLISLVDDGETASRYGVQTLPHLVLIDRRGQVRAVFIGEVREELVRRQVLSSLEL